MEIDYHRGEAYLKGVGQRMVLLHQAGSESAQPLGAAISAEQTGDKVGTVLEYLRALAVEPNSGTLLRLAIALHRVGLTELAVTALAKILQLNPDWDRASLNLDQIAGGAAGDEVVISEHKDSVRRLWESLPAVEPDSNCRSGR